MAKGEQERQEKVSEAMKELPFASLVPNAETISAMKEARGGNLPKFDDARTLLDDLHADD